MIDDIRADLVALSERIQTLVMCYGQPEWKFARLLPLYSSTSGQRQRKGLPQPNWYRLRAVSRRSLPLQVRCRAETKGTGTMN